MEKRKIKGKTYYRITNKELMKESQKTREEKIKLEQEEQKLKAKGYTEKQIQKLKEDKDSKIGKANIKYKETMLKETCLLFEKKMKTIKN